MTRQDKTTREKEAVEILIEYDFGFHSLYELGNLCKDLYDLVVVGELLFEEDWPTWMYRTRFLSLRHELFDIETYQAYRGRVELSYVGLGSIELVINVSPIIGAIVGFVLVKVATVMKERDERITFNVDSDDKELHTLMNNVERGYHGLGPAGIEWLLQYLKEKGYNIRADAKDVYTIEKRFEALTNRMIKSMPKYIRPSDD